VFSHALPFTRIPLPRYNIYRYIVGIYLQCWLCSGRGPGDRLCAGLVLFKSFYHDALVFGLQKSNVLVRRFLYYTGRYNIITV